MWKLMCATSLSLSGKLMCTLIPRTRSVGVQKERLARVVNDMGVASAKVRITWSIKVVSGILLDISSAGVH